MENNKIMNEKYYPIVVQALAGDNYNVFAYFTDGTIHMYDMLPLINAGGLFSRLKDKSYFENEITVMNDTVAWKIDGKYDPRNCIDIDPFELYEAKIVEDPLEKVV